MVIGRLAPSPTGAQHAGNARSFLIAWLSARSRQGRVVLRIEDFDSPRVKPWAVQQAIDDLRWLGLDWDEGPDVGGPHAPYIQTQRRESYDAALKQLKRQEAIYPCSCSRSDVAASASAPHFEQEGPIYPGTCAGRPASAINPAESFAWRFRTSDRWLEFTDRVAGRQRANVAQHLGDFVVAKADGTPAYQLAVVVDDHAMGITEVIRGSDLLPSAFRQLELYSFFHWQPPSFGHVPLVVGPDGRRLAKRHGDTRLSVIRDTQRGPEQLIGLLAWSCGLRATPAPTTAAELLDDFDLARIQSAPFTLTEELWRSVS